MANFDLKVKKTKSMHPRTKQPGYIARAIINGTETLETVAAEAARNTTLNRYELTAALGIVAEQFAQALKNGFAVDLGPLGKIYPTVQGKWTAAADEQRLAALKPRIRYDASPEIKDAMAEARLSWDKAADGADD